MSLDWPLPTMLPHSRAMILIGEPAASGHDWAEASVRIAEDSLFYEPGKGVPAWIGAEYMAQTVALFAGVASRRADEEIMIGLLLGSRQYKVSAPYFKLGSLLRVRGQRVWQDDRMAVFECRIDAESRLAEAQLSVYQAGTAGTFFGEVR